jgi:hypothetical protein
LELSLVLAFAKFNSYSKTAFARAKLVDLPLWRGIKGEDFSTSLTKACSDYASEWTRDPRRGGFKLIKAVLFTFF